MTYNARRYPGWTLPLVDIESEGPEWLEWCAALYESYAADHESMVAGLDRASRVRYASTAHTLCEELEAGVYESAAWEYEPDAIRFEPGADKPSQGFLDSLGYWQI